MSCDGCGETRTDVMLMTVGTSLITIATDGKTPETDIRGSTFYLCVECRRSVTAGLISCISKFVRGIRRSGT